MPRETRAAYQARVDGSAAPDKYLRDLATLEASGLNQDGTPYFKTVSQGLADSLHAGGEVTAPAAGAAIATLAAPPAGVYEVQVAVWISAAAAADATNVELRRGGSALYTPLVVATQFSFRKYRVTLTGSQNLTVNAIAVGTAGVIYSAEIVATRIE